MENNNYVSVGNIIEQERLKRQAQIAKGVNSDVYDHIEKAYQDDLSKGVEMTDNLSRFSDDVNNLNKAETEFLLSKLQRQIVVDPKSSLLKSFKSIAINHLNDLEKAHQDGEMHPNGKWVWVSSANGGKGDWRTANGRAHKKHQETHGKKDGEDERKTVDDHAAGASTDALKRAASDEKAKPEVREAAKKELEKRNNDDKQKRSSQSSKVDISKIPDAEFKRITQMLEKKNPDHTDASRHLEEEAMSDKELKNFYAVAEHFKNSSKINKMTQEYCKKWSELARQEMQYRKKRKGSGDSNGEKSENNTASGNSSKIHNESDKSKNSENKANSQSGFTEEDSKRFEELRGIINSPSWHSFLMSNTDDGMKIMNEYHDLRQKSFNQQLKNSGALTREDFNNINGVSAVGISESVDDNGKLITPYIEITLDKKKDVKNFIKDIKNKFGIEVSEDAFEFSPRNRYSDSHYTICVNPQTNEFDNSGNVNKSIKDNYYAKKQKTGTDSSAVNEIRRGKITTKSVEKFLEDDNAKSKAFMYFNYGDDSDCTEEEVEAFNNLEKLGAKLGKYFDWTEEAQSNAYKMKMQTKGYRVFDISTSDGYLWLMIKNDKLKGDDIKKS